MANEHTEVSPPAGATGVPATETDIPQQTRDMGQAIMTKEDVIDFMDFRPNDLNKALEVKVYRKWMLRNVLHPNPIGLCFILLDKQMTSGIDRPTPHTNICVSCSSPSAAHDTAPRVRKRVIHQTSDAGRYTRFNSNASKKTFTFVSVGPLVIL